jgi:predicted GNAT family N-acyltransferase
MSGFTVRAVTWAEAASLLASVRRAVFVIEQNVPEELEWDGEDEGAVHALATDEQGKAIGTGRLIPSSGHIGRMAVLPSWRRRGVGSAILATLLAVAERGRCLRVFLNAQTAAIPFYERFGFCAVGPVFEDAGIPHRRMERDINFPRPQG